jgi:hypothetical protein
MQCASVGENCMEMEEGVTYRLSPYLVIIHEHASATTAHKHFDALPDRQALRHSGLKDKCRSAGMIRRPFRTGACRLHRSFALLSHGTGNVSFTRPTYRSMQACQRAIYWLCISGANYLACSLLHRQGRHQGLHWLQSCKCAHAVQVQER